MLKKKDGLDLQSNMASGNSFSPIVFEPPLFDSLLGVEFLGGFMRRKRTISGGVLAVIEYFDSISVSSILIL